METGKLSLPVLFAGNVPNCGSRSASRSCGSSQENEDKKSARQEHPNRSTNPIHNVFDAVLRERRRLLRNTCWPSRVIPIEKSIKRKSITPGEAVRLNYGCVACGSLLELERAFY